VAFIEQLEDQIYSFRINYLKTGLGEMCEIVCTVGNAGTLPEAHLSFTNFVPHIPQLLNRSCCRAARARSKTKYRGPSPSPLDCARGRGQDDGFRRSGVSSIEKKRTRLRFDTLREECGGVGGLRPTLRRGAKDGAPGQWSIQLRKRTRPRSISCAKSAAGQRKTERRGCSAFRWLRSEVEIRRRDDGEQACRRC
jgi:hypothetical protein